MHTKFTEKDICVIIETDECKVYHIPLVKMVFKQKLNNLPSEFIIYNDIIFLDSLHPFIDT